MGLIIKGTIPRVPPFSESHVSKSHSLILKSSSNYYLAILGDLFCMVIRADDVQLKDQKVICARIDQLLVLGMGNLPPLMTESL